MREISIKALRANIRQEIDNLPVAITVRGKILAIMSTPEAKSTPKQGYSSTPEDKPHLPSSRKQVVIKQLKAEVKARAWEYRAETHKEGYKRRTTGKPMIHLPGDMCTKHGIAYQNCRCSLYE